VSIAFALLAAFSSAVYLLAQRVSSRSGPSGSAWRLAAYLLQQPLWLMGAAAGTAYFVFQAVALHFGELSVVQPVLVTELVFVLVLRVVWLRQPVRRAAWLSACLASFGLAVFLIAAEPRGGQASPTTTAWAGAIGVLGGISVTMTMLASRGRPGRRGALYAIAAGVVAALQAAFLKTAAETFHADGPLVMLADWPIYALLVSTIAETLLIQAALHVGPLTVSQPLMVVVNPLVSIWLSVWLFGEYFSADYLAVAQAGCGFVVMAVGVVLLTLTGPRQAGGPDAAPNAPGQAPWAPTSRIAGTDIDRP
jgi:drug/metabolite transporter (DMT)-like permease